MTPEKVAVLVITGVIAVLLSITLMGSPDGGGGELAAAPGGGAPRTESPPAPKDDLERFDFQTANQGGFRTILQPDPKPAPVGESEPPPAPSAPTRYKVVAGDTLAAIAKRVYGRKSMADEIQALNGNLDPRKLRPGMELLLPPKKGATTPRAAGATTPSTTPAVPVTGGERFHVVAKGDRLETIAKERYGKSSEWSRIFAANRDVLARPEALRPGMKLRIP